MIQSFREKNYYQILDLPPHASPYQVRRAYKEALEIYHKDSLVSYSLFTPEERQEIRTRIDDAFSTLMDEDRRAEYDRLLGSNRKSPEGPRSLEMSPPPAPTLDLAPSEGSTQVMAIMQEELQARAKASPAVQFLMAQEVVTGVDLKRVREELLLSLEQIAEQTKIRIHFLRALEADDDAPFSSRQHLKGFLKAYLRSLQLDAEPVASRYLKPRQEKT